MSDGGETLCSLARELLLAVWEENIPFYTYEEGRVTLSIGDEDCEACIKRADQALYVAKGRGHNIAVDYRKCRNSVPFGGKTRFRSRK